MLALRPFGRQARDLDVDFEHASPPHLITELLHRCGPADDTPADVWALPVGARIAALLRLAAAPRGDVLEAYVQCPACDERLELPLPVDALLSLHTDALARDHLELETDGRRLTLRRPTGRDQLDWQDRARNGHAPDEAALVDALLVEPVDEPVPDAALAALAEAMSGFDPLVHFEVEATCPACAHATRCLVPLQDLALDRLRRRQAALVEEVHRLATHYHWDERQIFALPPHRRARYLALIDRDHAL